MEIKFTERQKREKLYYRYFSQIHPTTSISFDPVMGKERRPWNPYWYVYEEVGRLFKSGKRILLDFGCGAGIASIRFAQIGFQVYAFDISDENIYQANELAKKYDFLKNIDFSVQTAENLEYKDDFFDLIVGIDILHHVEIDRAIPEIHRVLNKDGIAIFKEHVEAPVFDKLRRSKLITTLFPNHMSFNRHITFDERKLCSTDIKYICDKFKFSERKYFTLLSRMDTYLRKVNNTSASFWEKLDSALLYRIDALSKYCGTVVFKLTK
ncbi:MAG TPA: class I SAM-dependent methyltransferase [Syntrophobacteraceae bacterium]|nr:class I SAM-dependent methyltransferase [Syntrophobacteraceae bacterium]